MRSIICLFHSNFCASKNTQARTAVGGGCQHLHQRPRRPVRRSASTSLHLPGLMPILFILFLLVLLAVVLLAVAAAGHPVTLPRQRSVPLHG